MFPPQPENNSFSTKEANGGEKISSKSTSDQQVSALATGPIDKDQIQA